MTSNPNPDPTPDPTLTPTSPGHGIVVRWPLSVLPTPISNSEVPVICQTPPLTLVDPTHEAPIALRGARGGACPAARAMAALVRGRCPRGPGPAQRVGRQAHPHAGVPHTAERNPNPAPNMTLPHPLSLALALTLTLR